MADFSNADLSGCNLSNANLSGEDMSTVIFSYAELIGTDFSNAFLAEAVFTNASLDEADLTDADLEDADFSNADLTDAILGGAVLKNAILNKADFTGVDLSKVNGLTQSQLDTITYSSKRPPIIPEGFTMPNIKTKEPEGKKFKAVISSDYENVKVETKYVQSPSRITKLIQPFGKEGDAIESLFITFEEYVRFGNNPKLINAINLLTDNAQEFQSYQFIELGSYDDFVFKIESLFNDNNRETIELLENKAVLISYNPDLPVGLLELWNLILADPTQKMIMKIQGEPTLLFWIPAGIVCISLSARWGKSVYTSGPVTVIEDIAAMIQFVIENVKKS